MKAKKTDFQINRINPGTNAGFNLLFVLLAACAILPVVLVFMISISSEESIRQVGYSFFPVEFSSKAYQFLWNERDTILNALLISVAVTCIGTLLGLSVTTAMGYALSRPNFKLKQFYTWVIFIPMLFSGGLVASYVVNSNILGLRNTIWVLILPLMVSSYNIVICKTYFKTSIPDGIIESAKIDGANGWNIFWKITLPLIRPILVYVMITSMIGGLQMFDVPQILTNGKGGPDRTSTTMIMYLNNHLFSKNYGMAGAVSVVLFLVCAVLCVVVYFSLTKEDDGLTKAQRKELKAAKKAAAKGGK